MAYIDYNGKKIFYEIIGEGIPLIFLHGNSASSKMFQCVLDEYKNDYSIILIDFLGHGDSERLEKFEIDFWYDQSLQVISLIEILDLSRVNLLGTSGGALTAINVALERPDLVGKVIADSFEGTHSISSFADIVDSDRAESKRNEGARQFWLFNHGDDWESVVDNDTEVVKQHHKVISEFFHKKVSELRVPIYLIGTKEDEYIDNIESTYNMIAQEINECNVYIFEHGGHPSMISNLKEFAKMAKDFI